MDEIKSFVEEEPPTKVEKSKLLSKYNIPIHHLDFPYVEKCNKSRELERIIKVLRSGQEGIYPELTTAAENRLREIKPNSRLLIEVTPVLSSSQLNEKEFSELSTDLTKWVQGVSKNDQELLERKSISTLTTDCDIRKVKPSQENKSKNSIDKRISSTDYASWDKYDPDTEILKMDLKEEKIKKSAQKSQIIESEEEDYDYIFTTEAEALYEAKLEKQKGNEFYKAGEYNQALKHYNISLKCSPLVATYTNRALINMKMLRYSDAISDCKSALKIEPQNIKAHLRIGESYKQMTKYQQAYEHAEVAIEIDPNSKEAQELAHSVRELSGRSLTNTNKRFQIQDVEKPVKSKNKRINKSPKKKKHEEIIPIPGPSTMSPPYYKSMTYDLCRTIPLCALNLDDEDDDDCTVIHIGGEKQKTDNQTVRIDEAAGGDYKSNEAFNTVDLQQPYNFLQAWIAVKSDPTYKNYVDILKKIDFQRINEVIGCKMNDKMFSEFVNCLYRHFMVPDQIDRLCSALENLRQIPRFKIISTFISNADKGLIRQMFDFLEQHGHSLSNEIKADYFN